MAFIIFFFFLKKLGKVEKTGIISTKFSLRCTPSVILGIAPYLVCLVLKYFWKLFFRTWTLPASSCIVGIIQQSWWIFWVPLLLTHVTTRTAFQFLKNFKGLAVPRVVEFQALKKISKNIFIWVLNLRFWNGKTNKEIVFCNWNCSDLLWEKMF